MSNDPFLAALVYALSFSGSGAWRTAGRSCQHAGKKRRERRQRRRISMLQRRGDEERNQGGS